MASELVLNATLQYADSDDTADSLQVNDFLADLTSFKFVHAKQSIGTSEEAIILGEATTPRWFMAVNKDTTNFIEIRVASGGAKFAHLEPGAFCLLPLGSGATVPYAIADTAACLLEYWVGNAT